MGWLKTASAVFVGTLTAMIVLSLIMFLYIGTQLGNLGDELNQQGVTTDRSTPEPEDYYTTEP
jgi:uncharacterized membrane protein